MGEGENTKGESERRQEMYKEAFSNIKRVNEHLENVGAKKEDFDPTMKELVWKSLASLDDKQQQEIMDDQQKKELLDEVNRFNELAEKNHDIVSGTEIMDYVKGLIKDLA
jgi:hypothetical protein